MLNKLVFLCTFFTISLITGFSQNSISLSEIWALDSLLATPESVVYDPLRACLYVSNFNDKGGFRSGEDTLFDEYITKIDLDGNILDAKWVDRLIGPTGITIHEDILYVVERGYVTRIDIGEQKIIERIPVKGTGFLNDVEVDGNGDIYLSDSRSNGTIYRVRDGKSEVWLQDTILRNCNGLYLDDGDLIAGNPGAANLVAIRIRDKNIRKLVSGLSHGIDGIKKYGDNYLLSWRFEIITVDKQGNVFALLDTEETNDWNADFELISDLKLLIVPTLLSNKLKAYRIEDE